MSSDANALMDEAVFDQFGGYMRGAMTLMTWQLGRKLGLVDTMIALNGTPCTSVEIAAKANLKEKYVTVKCPR